jgi:hypothetical protein
MVVAHVVVAFHVKVLCTKEGNEGKRSRSRLLLALCCHDAVLLDLDFVLGAHRCHKLECRCRSMGSKALDYVYGTSQSASSQYHDDALICL